MNHHAVRAACDVALGAIAAGTGVAPAGAQQDGSFEFAIESVMRDPEVYGREPAQVRWSPDGQWLDFQLAASRSGRSRDAHAISQTVRGRRQAGAPDRCAVGLRRPADRERLIELGKPNWDLAVYPVERHAFTRPVSWSGEDTRSCNLIEAKLAEPVPTAVKAP